MHRRLSNLASVQKRVAQIKSISALSIDAACSLQPEACTLCPATPTCFPECAHTHTHGARHVCKACLSVGGVWVVGGVCVGRVAAFPVAVYIVKWLGSKIVREIVLKFVWTMINVA